MILFAVPFFILLLLLVWTTLPADGQNDNNEVVVLNFSRNQNTNPNLTLSLVRGGSPLYQVIGETGNSSSVFSTFKEDSSRYISVTLGNITKENLDLVRGEPQISFTFDIKGQNRDYHLTVVNGRSGQEGWSDGTYFYPLNESSSVLVDLVRLIGSQADNYDNLYRITLTLEREMKVSPLEFSINFFGKHVPADPITNVTNKIIN